MTRIRIAALSARSVALCLPLPGAKYALPEALPWRLIRDGAVVVAGLVDRTLMTLHDLSPDTGYTFEVEGLPPVSFVTKPCAGLVDFRDFGATADGEDTADQARSNAEALAEAIVATPRGGTLRVPAGRFICGPVALRSELTLELARGATLAAPSDRYNWPILPPEDAHGMLGSWEGLPAACFAAPIHAIRAQYLTITGPGALDGGGNRGDWWQWPKETRQGARRPRGLHLIGCEDVQLIGFAIRNASSWTIHPQNCERLIAAGLDITAPPDSPNTDGFNPEMCRDLTIVGCDFSVGDDCIAIKAGKRGPAGETDHLRPTRRIDIRHCRMKRGHGGVVIGSEMSGGVSRITVHACEMHGTDRGLRIKTRRGRGGQVDDVAFGNVLLNGVQTAFSANAHYFCDADGHEDWVQDRSPATVTDTTPRIGTIAISDIEVRGLEHALGAFLGLSEAPFGPITIKRVRLTSLNPDAAPAPPLMADHVRALKHAGLLVENSILHAPELEITFGGLTDTAPVLEQE